jgi:hypothetical protein
VPAGDFLFVATYDGVVRALAPAALVGAPATAPVGGRAAAEPAAGCGCMGAGETTGIVAGGVLLLVVMIVLLRRSRRFDGRPATGVPPYRRIIPFLMQGKNEAVVYFESRIDLHKTVHWIEDWNRAHAPQRITIFHVVLAALARTLHERPRLNRFVSGHRLWQRRGVYLSFAAKKKMNDDAPLSTVKREFPAGERFADMVAALAGDVGAAKSEAKSAVDKEVSALLRMPGPLLRAMIRMTRALDQVNLAPAALLRNDPMYTSVFVANLGSIELDAAYHHLYEWGNCPLFATLGRIEKDGNRTVAIVKFSYDERVEDGLYAARSLEKFRAYVEDPAAWVE